MRKTYFISIVLLITTTLKSCSEDEERELVINPEKIDMFVGDTQTVKASGGISGYEFSSSNELIASVVNDGVVTAVRVGDAEIIVHGGNNLSAKCKVTVKGKNTMYTEPCLQFGASKAQVKAFEKRMFLEEDNEFIFYKGENEYVNNIAYNFSDDKLNSSTTFIHANKSTDKLLNEFITERYVPLDFDNPYTSFLSPDAKIMVEISLTVVGRDSYYVVLYTNNLTNSVNTG